jgi:hypothetical protein
VSVTWRGEELVRRVETAVFRGVVRGTERVAERVVTSQLQAPRGGRTYDRGTHVHVASAPGEPPAPDTGRLVQSVHTAYERPRLAGRVIESTAYAAGLEFGTERVEPRPHMRPALTGSLPDIERDVANEVRRVLSAGGSATARTR